MESWSDALEGLSLLDLHILKLSSEKPDIILKDIREKLDIPHITLTSAINRLEQQDLLNRVISQRDLRSFGLELMQKGISGETRQRITEIADHLGYHPSGLARALATNRS